MNGRARELEVHRHRDEPRAHDAVVRREILGPVGRQDGNAVAACEAAPRKRAGDAVRHVVDLPVAEFARACLAAEVDHDGPAQVTVTADQVAEIGEGSHRMLGSRELDDSFTAR